MKIRVFSEIRRYYNKPNWYPDLGYAFYACIKDIIPKLGISGHTHSNYDIEHLGTRLISNCVGYIGEFTQGAFTI